MSGALSEISQDSVPKRNIRRRDHALMDLMDFSGHRCHVTSVEYKGPSSRNEVDTLFNALSIDEFIQDYDRKRWSRARRDGCGLYEPCRFCGDEEESVEHIISKCQRLAPSQYRSRHDKVARALHWCLCEVHGIGRTSDDWTLHQVKEVTETKDVKIFWDFRMRLLKREVHHDRPDIVVVDKRLKRVYIVEVAVSRDSLVVNKQQYKKDKYEELAEVMGLSWVMDVSVLPVIVGAFGNMCDESRSSLRQLQIKVDPLFLQKIAFSETIVILRKALHL